MKLLKNSTIKSNIFIVSILQTATPILLVGIISSIITLNILKVQTFNNTNALFYDVSSKITDFSDKIFDLSQNLLYDDDMFNIIAFNQDSSAYDTVRLNDILVNNPDIQSVKLVLDTHEYTVSQGKSTIYQYGSIGYNNVKRMLEDTPESSLWYATYQKNDTSDIFFSRLIKNPYTNETRGILFFQISNRVFSGMLSFAERSDNSQFCILASNNLPLAKNFDLSDDVISKISNSKDGVTSLPGKYYFYSTLSGLNWKIVCCVDKYSLYRLLYLLIGLIILLCIISIIVVVFFTQHINKTVVSPIQKLSKAMRTWNENKIFKKKQDYEISEIDMLYDDFQNMTQSITDLININYKSTLVQRESELKMLQAQINPHFIFNTLESINSLAIIHDAHEISDITLAFSELIEQSIGYEAESLHTLEQELHLLDCYITIMQIRFGNKISIIKDIDDDTLTVLMPRLTLQPVIENSINHGIIPSGRKCDLKIEAHIIKSDLIIKIYDNGIGIGKDELSILNNSFIAEKSSVEKSIGLININKRLKLLYGDEYHLRISSEENKFTEVVLNIKISE